VRVRLIYRFAVAVLSWLALLARSPASENAEYQPLLVLLLAELTAVDAIVTPSSQSMVTGTLSQSSQGAATMAARLAGLDDLISSGLAQLRETPSAPVDKDAALRLRLLCACYDAEQRDGLVDVSPAVAVPTPNPAAISANVSPLRRYTRTSKACWPGFSLRHSEPIAARCRRMIPAT